MYIRLRQNPSGTKTVYLVDSYRAPGKKHATYKAVRCFGSSADEEQLRLWVAEAEKLKDQLVSQKISSSKFIKVEQPKDITSAEVDDIGVSYVYNNLFDKYFSGIRLKSNSKKTFSDLVTMRLVEPVSKLKTAAISSSYGIDGLSVNKIYKLMDELDDKKIELIKKQVFKNTKKLLGGSNQIKVMFYDLTTIYFEANSQTELKEFGYSKDGKSQHVQISLAMIVTDCGLPISYEIFKGNTFEGNTLIPTLIKLREQYKISNVTIVADSAMLSAANIKSLKENNFKYIIAARIRNLKEYITKEIISKDGYNLLSSNNEDSFSYKEIDYGNETLIACYSDKRRRKDEYERQKIIARINEHIKKSPKSNLAKPLIRSYVDIIGKEGEVAINKDKLEESKQLDGYFGYISNCKLTPLEIIGQYRGLWQVEQTFRITKNNLKIRPVFHFVDRRIKAHFAICFMALSMARVAEYKLKKAGINLPLEQLHTMLNKIKQIKLTVGDNQCNILTNLPENASQVFTALDINLPSLYSVVNKLTIA